MLDRHPWNMHRRENHDFIFVYANPDEALSNISFDL